MRPLIIKRTGTWLLGLLWARMVRLAYQGRYKRALAIGDIAIAIFRKLSPGQPRPPARLMLLRAHLILQRGKYEESLRAQYEFLKSLEIDRTLERDERKHMILYAAVHVIFALRHLGRPVMMDELKPFWSADFSEARTLNVPKPTRGIFPFDPPTIPFDPAQFYPIRTSQNSD